MCVPYFYDTLTNNKLYNKCITKSSSETYEYVIPNVFLTLLLKQRIIVASSKNQTLFRCFNSIVNQLVNK